MLSYFNIKGEWKLLAPEKQESKVNKSELIEKIENNIKEMKTLISQIKG